jgi:NitT/TauT family transport system substrate-binding protein
MPPREEARMINRADFLAGAAATTIAQAGSLTAIRVGSTSSDDAVSVVYAQKAGLFAKAGLDVAIERQNNGAAIASAVAGGAFEFGKSSLPSLIQAHDRGVPFVSVAPGAIYDTKAPYAVTLLPKDSPVRSGKDAANLTFSAASLSDLGHLAMRAWVDKHGGDSTTVKFVEIPFTAVAAAVQQGRVAGGELSEPTLDSAMATGNFRFLKTGDAIASSFYITVWFTTKEYAAKNPQIVRSFSRAVAQGAAYTNGHHAETAQMMADYTSAQLDIVQKMTRAIEGVTLNAAQIQPLIDTMVKYGLIKNGFSAQEMIDPSAVTR